MLVLALETVILIGLIKMFTDNDVGFWTSLVVFIDDGDRKSGAGGLRRRSDWSVGDLAGRDSGRIGLGRHGGGLIWSGSEKIADRRRTVYVCASGHQHWIGNDLAYASSTTRFLRLNGYPNCLK